MVLVRWISMVLMVGSPLPAHAEPEPAPSRTENEIVQVVTLAHTHAVQVVEAINELGFEVAGAAVAENRLILHGSAAQVQIVLQEIIAKVDVPGVDGGQSTIDYIPLSRRPPSGLEALLEAVAPRDFGTHYAIDPGSRLIAVNAPKERVASIRRLVELTDRAGESFLIHFSFLRGKVGAVSAAKGSDTLPKGLTGVASALQSAGFTDVELAAPLLIQSLDGSKFESSVEQARDGREEGDDLGIHVKGTVLADGTGSTVQLDLEVRLLGRAVQIKESGNVVTFPTLLSAQSTITLKLDQSVVLAAAPAVRRSGDAYAVAVKVTRAATGKP